jgi:hypothetical protein
LSGVTSIPPGFATRRICSRTAGPEFSPAAALANNCTATESYDCEVNTPGASPYSDSNAEVNASCAGPPAAGAVPVTFAMSLPTCAG